jgi:hypothetical protein
MTTRKAIQNSGYALLAGVAFLLTSCGTTDKPKSYRVPGVMGSLQARVPSERYAPVRQAPPRARGDVRRTAVATPSLAKRKPVNTPSKKPWYHIRLPSIKKAFWNDKTPTTKKTVKRSYTPVPRQPIPGQQETETKE